MKTYICDCCKEEYKKEYHQNIKESEGFFTGIISPVMTSCEISKGCKINQDKILHIVSEFLDKIGDYCNDCKQSLSEEIIEMLGFEIHRKIEKITKD